MNYKCILILFFYSYTLGQLEGQSTLIPQNYSTSHFLDRVDILHNVDITYHTSIQPIYRKNMMETLLRISPADKGISSVDRSSLEYIFQDNRRWYSLLHEDIDSREINLSGYEKIYVDSTETFYSMEPTYETGINTESWKIDEESKPFLGIFYKSPESFLEFETADFYVKINPVINFQYGKAVDNDVKIFQNTRGFDISGSIDNKVYFYTSLFETQQRFNDFIEKRIADTKAIPGQGFYKTYESSIIGGLNGWDFLNAQAYVGLNVSKSIGLEFGHGKHFIGNGYHSLLLGDYSHNYFYLKFNTNVWKFQYQNIFAELSTFGSRDNIDNTLIPKKYMAAHYLDFNVTKDFSIGLYEAVIFNRTDHFEFQYLNPVIIYRTVELFLDSPDNVLIGLNTRYNFLNQFQVYGQLIMDEFKLSEIKEGNGWWANKFGYQLGMKYMDMFNIPQLDGQVEYNVVRPYTYAHRDTIPEIGVNSIASYSHYNQPLAHPLGANFKEVLLKLRYQPMSRLVLDGRFIYTKYGDDDDQNWGGNILKTYETRPRDFGNIIGQGIKTNITQIGLDVSYMVYHNVFVDLHLLLRNQESELETKTFDTKFFGLGIRMNMENKRLDY